VSARLSVLRTPGLRSARLQIELNGLSVAVELTADLARVVGNRLMMIDPFLMPEDRLPITEEGSVRIGGDGAVEIFGGRRQNLAQFDPLVGCDLRIGVLLVEVRARTGKGAARSSTFCVRPIQFLRFSSDMTDFPPCGAGHCHCEGRVERRRPGRYIPPARNSPTGAADDHVR